VAAEQSPTEKIKPNMIQPEIIQYTSDGLTLKGYFYKPAGNGPFPAYMWNHGSEQYPSAGQKLAEFWTSHGFVFFAPIRSGHGDNPGSYIADEQKELKGNGPGRMQMFPQVEKLHERANDDVVAAFQWLKKQPSVDPKRIVVAGGSFGGIQTVLTAGRDGRQNLGVKCFVAMSPAAMSWGQGKTWGPYLTQQIRSSKAPIFLLQAQNDYNLGPSEVLGPVVDAKGYPSRHKIFPPHNDPTKTPKDPRQQGHGLFFNDPSAWQDDVLKYLKDCGVIK
jgi:dienelactone hydrolase